MTMRPTESGGDIASSSSSSLSRNRLSFVSPHIITPTTTTATTSSPSSSSTPVRKTRTTKKTYLKGSKLLVKKQKKEEEARKSSVKDSLFKLLPPTSPNGTSRSSSPRIVQETKEDGIQMLKQDLVQRATISQQKRKIRKAAAKITQQQAGLQQQPQESPNPELTTTTTTTLASNDNSKEQERVTKKKTKTVPSKTIGKKQFLANLKRLSAKDNNDSSSSSLLTSTKEPTTQIISTPSTPLKTTASSKTSSPGKKAKKSIPTPPASSCVISMGDDKTSQQTTTSTETGATTTTTATNSYKPLPSPSQSSLSPSKKKKKKIVLVAKDGRTTTTTTSTTKTKTLARPVKASKEQFMANLKRLSSTTTSTNKKTMIAPNDEDKDEIRSFKGGKPNTVQSITRTKTIKKVSKSRGPIKKEQFLANLKRLSSSSSTNDNHQKQHHQQQQYHHQQDEEGQPKNYGHAALSFPSPSLLPTTTTTKTIAPTGLLHPPTPTTPTPSKKSSLKKRPSTPNSETQKRAHLVRESLRQSLHQTSLNNIPIINDDDDEEDDDYNKNTGNDNNNCDTEEQVAAVVVVEEETPRTLKILRPSLEEQEKAREQRKLETRAKLAGYSFELEKSIHGDNDNNNNDPFGGTLKKKKKMKKPTTSKLAQLKKKFEGNNNETQSTTTTTSNPPRVPRSSFLRQQTPLRPESDGPVSPSLSSPKKKVASIQTTISPTGNKHRHEKIAPKSGDIPLVPPENPPRPVNTTFPHPSSLSPTTRNPDEDRFMSPTKTSERPPFSPLESSHQTGKQQPILLSPDNPQRPLPRAAKYMLHQEIAGVLPVQQPLDDLSTEKQFIPGDGKDTNAVRPNTDQAASKDETSPEMKPDADDAWRNQNNDFEKSMGDINTESSQQPQLQKQEGGGMDSYASFASAGSSEALLLDHATEKSSTSIEHPILSSDRNEPPSTASRCSMGNNNDEGLKTRKTSIRDAIAARRSIAVSISTKEEAESPVVQKENVDCPALSSTESTQKPPMSDDISLLSPKMQPIPAACPSPSTTQSTRKIVDSIHSAGPPETPVGSPRLLRRRLKSPANDVSPRLPSGRNASELSPVRPKVLVRTNSTSGDKLLQLMSTPQGRKPALLRQNSAAGERLLQLMGTPQQKRKSAPVRQNSAAGDRLLQLMSPKQHTAIEPSKPATSQDSQSNLAHANDHEVSFSLITSPNISSPSSVSNDLHGSPREQATTDLHGVLKHLLVLNDLKDLVGIAPEDDNGDGQILYGGLPLSYDKNNVKRSRFQQMFKLKCALLEANVPGNVHDDGTLDSNRKQSLIDQFDLERDDVDFIIEHIQLSEEERTEIRWDLIETIVFPDIGEETGTCGCVSNASFSPRSQRHQMNASMSALDTTGIRGPSSCGFWNSVPNLEAALYGNNDIIPDPFGAASPPYYDDGSSDDDDMDYIERIHEYQEVILELFEETEAQMAHLSPQERQSRRMVLVQLLQATSEDEAHLSNLSVDDVAEIVHHVRICQETETPVQWDMVQDIVFPLGIDQELAMAQPSPSMNPPSHDVAEKTGFPEAPPFSVHDDDYDDDSEEEYDDDSEEEYDEDIEEEYDEDSEEEYDDDSEDEHDDDEESAHSNNELDDSDNDSSQNADDAASIQITTEPSEEGWACIDDPFQNHCQISSRKTQHASGLITPHGDTAIPQDSLAHLFQLTDLEMNTVLSHINMCRDLEIPIRWDLIGEVLFPGDEERQDMLSKSCSHFNATNDNCNTATMSHGQEQDQQQHHHHHHQQQQKIDEVSLPKQRESQENGTFQSSGTTLIKNESKLFSFFGNSSEGSRHRQEHNHHKERARAVLSLSNHDLKLSRHDSSMFESNGDYDSEEEDYDSDGASSSCCSFGEGDSMDIVVSTNPLC